MIFIDDLDRLPLERAVEVLEVLKLFLDCKYCIYVLAIDYSVVVRGVKGKYREDFDESKGRAFFDKIIQVPFKVLIAEYDITNYISDCIKKCGIKNEEKKERKMYEEIIQLSVGNNPRTIKRLFNTFMLMYHVNNKFFEVSEKRKMLFCLLCMQNVYESIYNFLISHREDKETVKNVLTGKENILEQILLEKNDQTNKIKKDRKDVVIFLEKVKNSIEENSMGNISDDRVEEFIEILSYSNISSTNEDVSKSIQNHTENKDSQYIIRKIFNRFAANEDICLEKEENFGKETFEQRNSKLKEEYQNDVIFNRIRVTGGKGQGICFEYLSEEGEKIAYVYLSADRKGIIPNDGIQLKNCTDIYQIEEKNDRRRKFDAAELRMDDNKFEELFSEIEKRTREQENIRMFYGRVSIKKKQETFKKDLIK